MIRYEFSILRFFCLFLIVSGWSVKTVNFSPILFREEWRSEEPTIPPLRTQITDTTSTLTDLQKSRLTSTLVAFEKRKGSQIAVLVVGSTLDWSVEEYAVKVFESWKLGRQGVDDGILIVVAIGDHKTKIEVGYGLEGVVPDVIAKRIIEDYMIPQFREGNYYKGISDAVDALIAKIDGEELPAASGKVADSLFENSESIERISELVRTAITTVVALVFLFLISGIPGKLFGLLIGNRISSVFSVIIFVILGLFWSISLWLLTPGAILVWFFVLIDRSFSGGSSSRGGGSSSRDSFSGGFGGSSGGGGASGSW
ncbi:TPM domain-containing protein [Leptospira santarosai]|uniref:TPM domain-containing protein n=1 Tax=Leptospira santarosai TaxID=28183 RepID=UPI0024AEAEE2|nr:TPM domain-containing protein [Leptospira santarosai]MDI7182982.1 TPM domain-containing protein [Leptospira santarosai]MDI7183005.1 TPM domain-containing protein [Leptospira santarosai]